MRTEDFIQDDLFVKWLISNDEYLEKYWSEWLYNNPAELENFNAAKQFVQKAKAALHQDNTKEEELLWQQIRQKIQLPQSEMQLPQKSKKMWWAAAALLVLASSAILFYLNKSNKTSDTISYKEVEIKKDVDDYIIRTNETTEPQTIYLPDGSMILLEPGSSVKTKSLFNQKQREVYLSGEAFFNVSKNTGRPFFVFTGNTVTKVLGTTFRIKTLPGEGKVLIAVSSGLVSVNNRAAANKNSTEIVLYPNQQVVLADDTEPVKEAVKDERLIVKPEFYKEDFTFENVPVPVILDKLSKIYSVDISYSKDFYKNCELTTSLNDESFYEKLTILCKAIGASYTVSDAKIKIVGGACD